MNFIKRLFANWGSTNKATSDINQQNVEPTNDWDNLYPLTDEDLRRFEMGWFWKPNITWWELVWRESKMKELRDSKWREYQLAIYAAERAVIDYQI